VQNLSKRLAKLSPLTLLALAACGGVALSEPPIRSEGIPTVTTLAVPAGPGAGRLRAGDLPAARAAFEAALASDAGRLGPLNDLAVSYLLEGHLDAARRLLDEVVASGSAEEQQAALTNLGELYALEGHREAAQAYLESARSLDEGRAGPLYALALLADGRGDAAAARSLLRRALDLDDGAARAALAFAFPEEQRHLEALLAEAAGDGTAAEARWRELSQGRFPALSAAAARHLADPAGANRAALP